MISVIKTRFGENPSLELNNGEWIKNGMGAKTANLNGGHGGLLPEVNLEDKEISVAMIDDTPAKSLASILVWGEDPNWDWSRHFNEVAYYLAANMIRRCKEDGRGPPQACTHSLTELAWLMARMVLHFELYELWDTYTVKGRLLFSGIAVKASTYTNVWLTYQRQMTHDLFDMVGKADYCVSAYRKLLDDAC